MSWLAKRKWYLASLILILGAIATLVIGNYHHGGALVARTRARVVPSLSEAERLSLRQLASWHSRQSAQWGLISMGSLVLAVCSALISRRRRECGRLSVVLLLFAMYFLLFFGLMI
jgi:hypothetical protein